MASNARLPFRLSRLVVAVNQIVGHATCGLPAGCGFADLLVMVYCIEPFDAVEAAHPEAHGDYYVDDLTVRTGRCVDGVLYSDSEVKGHLKEEGKTQVHWGGQAPEDALVALGDVVPHILQWTDPQLPLATLHKHEWQHSS